MRQARVWVGGWVRERYGEEECGGLAGGKDYRPQKDCASCW